MIPGETGDQASGNDGLVTDRRCEREINFSGMLRTYEKDEREKERWRLGRYPLSFLGAK